MKPNLLKNKYLRTVAQIYQPAIASANTEEINDFTYHTVSWNMRNELTVSQWMPLCSNFLGFIRWLKEIPPDSFYHTYFGENWSSPWACDSHGRVSQTQSFNPIKNNSCIQLSGCGGAQKNTDSFLFNPLFLEECNFSTTSKSLHLVVLSLLLLVKHHAQDTLLITRTNDVALVHWKHAACLLNSYLRILNKDINISLPAELFTLLKERQLHRFLQNSRPDGFVRTKPTPLKKSIWKTI